MGVMLSGRCLVADWDEHFAYVFKSYCCFVCLLKSVISSGQRAVLKTAVNKHQEMPSQSKNTAATLGIFVSTTFMLAALLGAATFGIVVGGLGHMVNESYAAATVEAAAFLILPPMVALCIFIRILKQTKRGEEISRLEISVYWLMGLGFFVFQFWFASWNFNAISLGTLILLGLLYFALSVDSLAVLDARN